MFHEILFHLVMCVCVCVVYVCVYMVLILGYDEVCVSYSSLGSKHLKDTILMHLPKLPDTSAGGVLNRT